MNSTIITTAKKQKPDSRKRPSNHPPVSDLSTLTQKDYNISLRAVLKEMCRLGVSSIGDMDPHDIAVEAMINSQRWGGMSYVSRRAKLLVVEKLRHHTGSRRRRNKGPREVQFEYLNPVAPPQETSKRDVEELLNSLSIPEKIRDMLRMKIFHGMLNKDISVVMGVNEPYVSRTFGEWAHPIKDMLNKRASKDGFSITTNIKNRSKNYDRSNKKKDSEYIHNKTDI